MNSKLSLLLLLAIGVSAKPPHHVIKNVGTSVGREKVDSKPVSSEYLEKFSKFSEKLVRSPSFNIAGSYEKKNDRAVFVHPLSLGYFYSILSEDVFKIRTDDIVNALGVPLEDINKVYTALGAEAKKVK